MSNWKDPERAREYYREYRARRRAAGRCRDCNAELPPERRGKASCQSCIDRERRTAAARREADPRKAEASRRAKRTARREAKAQRICTSCQLRPAARERTLCLACNAAFRASHARRRERLAAAGRCEKCGGEKEPGRTTAQCGRCLARAMALNAARPKRRVSERRKEELDEVRRDRAANRWLAVKW